MGLRKLLAEKLRSTYQWKADNRQFAIAIGDRLRRVTT